MKLNVKLRDKTFNFSLNVLFYAKVLYEIDGADPAEAFYNDQ